LYLPAAEMQVQSIEKKPSRCQDDAMKDLDRWLILWGSMGAQGDPQAAFAQLERGYQSPVRFYHTLEHVHACLEELDGARQLCAHPDCVELALWFHDVVYDPRAVDNEARSAERLRDAAREMRLDADFARHASEIVLETAHAFPRKQTTVDADAAVACDVDLSILGKPTEIFAAYEEGIRKERAFVSEDEFRERRARILAGFLAMPQIYQCVFFRDKYEKRARVNLSESIKRLTRDDR
jgi:predicted metal-dependent HD superfamily phosphohydrolase